MIKKVLYKSVLFFVTLILLMNSAVAVHSLSNEQKALYNKNILYYDLGCSSVGSSSGSVSVDGETTGPPEAVQKIVWETLRGGGIDEIHTAAVMGNIAHEGLWNPKQTEFAANIPGDESEDPSVVGSYGYGLIGWTPGTRLLDSMKEAGISGKPYTAETQAAVILAHIKGKTPSQYPPEIGRKFLATTTIEAATTAYQGTASEKGFENPADPVATLDDRKDSAREMLRRYSGNSFSASGEISDADECCPSGGGTIQQGASNEETIWNFLVTPEASGGLGLNDTQAAGVLGNIEQESGFNPTAENGSSGAYGIAQWAYERRAALEHYANKQGKDKSDITIQLEYMKLELTEGYAPAGVGSYKSTVYDPLKASRTMEQAVLIWLEAYEKPCPNPTTGSCEDEMRRRLPFAQDWYDKFAGSGSGGSVSAGTGCGGSASGGLPSGESKDLAQKLLPYIRNGKISCNGQAPDCPDIKKTANGTSTKTSDSCWVDKLDPKLLGMLLKLVESGHTFVFSSICSDHPSNPSSYHHKGKAVDFNYIDGVFMGPSATAPWTGEKLEAGKRLVQDAASFMPKSTGFGQTNCHPSFPFLNGFSTFSDSCHHQHIQVE